MVSSTLNHTQLVQKLFLGDKATKILNACVHLLLIVELYFKPYFAASYFGDVCFLPPMSPNE